MKTAEQIWEKRQNQSVINLAIEKINDTSEKMYEDGFFSGEICLNQDEIADFEEAIRTEEVQNLLEENEFIISRSDSNKYYLVIDLV